MSSNHATVATILSSHWLPQRRPLIGQRLPRPAQWAWKGGSGGHSCQLIIGLRRHPRPKTTSLDLIDLFPVRKYTGTAKISLITAFYETFPTISFVHLLAHCGQCRGPANENWSPNS